MKTVRELPDGVVIIGAEEDQGCLETLLNIFAPPLDQQQQKGTMSAEVNIISAAAELLEQVEAIHALCGAAIARAEEMSIRQSVAKIRHEDMARACKAYMRLGPRTQARFDYKSFHVSEDMESGVFKGMAYSKQTLQRSLLRVERAGFEVLSCEPESKKMPCWHSIIIKKLTKAEHRKREHNYKVRQAFS